MGLKSNLVLDASLGVSPSVGEQRTGDAFVPHNELFESCSVPDD